MQTPLPAESPEILEGPTTPYETGHELPDAVPTPDDWSENEHSGVEGPPIFNVCYWITTQLETLLPASHHRDFYTKDVSIEGLFEPQAWAAYTDAEHELFQNHGRNEVIRLAAERSLEYHCCRGDAGRTEYDVRQRGDLLGVHDDLRILVDDGFFNIDAELEAQLNAHKGIENTTFCTDCAAEYRAAYIERNSALARERSD